MQIKTTTQQIQNAIKNNLLILEKQKKLQTKNSLRILIVSVNLGFLLILLAGIFRKIAKLEFMKLKQAAWMEELILLLRLISARVMM